jgi:hypothetical protein
MLNLSRAITCSVSVLRRHASTSAKSDQYKILVVGGGESMLGISFSVSNLTRGFNQEAVAWLWRVKFTTASRLLAKL